MPKKDSNTTIQDIKDHLDAYTAERDWHKFHEDPKNTLMALVEEVGELAALYRFTTTEEAKLRSSDPNWSSKVKDETADVFAQLLLFATVNKIDVASAFYSKSERAALKYPVGKVRGKMDKYDTYAA